MVINNKKHKLIQDLYMKYISINKNWKRITSSGIDKNFVYYKRQLRL